jgi:hypothetical protein
MVLHVCTGMHRARHCLALVEGFLSRAFRPVSGWFMLTGVRECHVCVTDLTGVCVCWPGSAVPRRVSCTWVLGMGF